MIKIICVCGARPNFMKIAPLMKAFNQSGKFQTLLVHTGQHYDQKMSTLFFDELNIPKPDINLEVGSGSHAVQTAEVMKRFEPVVLDFKPDYVLVVGDVNSTIACGMVAVKIGVKLIHVEAGLRSFDRSMPEEINRVLTDSISDILFVTEQSGIDNLKNEGVNSDKVYLVGNVMIDTLLANKDKAEKSDILEKLYLEKKKYAVITLHRPSNVDDMNNLEKIISAFEVIQKDLKLVFPIHPRTKKNIEGSSLQARVTAMTNLILLEPVGYLDFLKLTANAAIVITDSGGIQEETTILGVPCMTLRENTERPVTVAEGTNRLIHIDTQDIIKHYNQIKSANFEAKGRIPKFWDGKAAERIAQILLTSYR
ncbi:MAG: UDP-N-acetylglucosamine 2-epimerase [Planctomycetes bacterium GWC2_45_44]|nr:MAG: UDP-N-acetylglucosamine 2-epimerase [Planctomycetes bacterium GWC2_45_44]HBR18943.1 UDP-N-acetylglucosamine 2-epimerase (non-hydrolyzing) [Phycisphaerales bacterium]